jgi:hypothetical protein
MGTEEEKVEPLVWGEGYEPKGIRWTLNNKEYMMVDDEACAFNEWIAYRHSDGQWVSLRKATEEDKRRLLLLGVETKEHQREKYKGRCLTCIHWKGDKENQWEMIKRDPKCMDLSFQGWPLDGECSYNMYWLYIESEDGSGKALVDANFGCVYWKDEEKGEKERNNHGIDSKSKR